MKLMLRVSAFVIKEIRTILVQPQLLLLLVAGPFIVLLAFGLGYRPKTAELKTIIVQPNQKGQQDVAAVTKAVGPPMRVVRITNDRRWALGELEARRVELVVVVPEDAQDMLLAGQNVQLTFYHNEIDPSRIGYIEAVVDGATSHLNETIVQNAVSQQQVGAGDYEQVLLGLQAALNELQAAVRAGDRDRARLLTQGIRVGADQLATLPLMGLQVPDRAQAPGARLAQQAQDLETQLNDPGTPSATLEKTVTAMQADNEQLLTAVRRARQIAPGALVAPLAYHVEAVSPYLPGYVAYHSPTVLALLVQHLCITLAALSLVDERSAGAIEIFRTAPVTAGEILAGKFLAYTVLVAITSVGLVFLSVTVLKVPLLGDWRWLAVVLFALMAYSLMLGFLVSAVAHSRSQAIQMSMLLLLGSIFFSGFFVPIDDYAVPVRALSYSQPVTNGIVEQREVVLRGEAPAPLFLGIMGVWAIGLCLVAERLFRKQFVANS